MPFLASIGATLGANAIKIGLALVLAAALFGGGYVMGDTHATKVALQAGASAIKEAVDANAIGYQRTIADYVAKVKAANQHSDDLAKQLADAQAALTAPANISKEKIRHAMPENLVCDIPSAALDELRAQAARR